MAEAFILGEEFIKDSNVCLILGDNIFYGQGFSEKLINAKINLRGAKIFGYKVKNPQEFGVIEFNSSKCIASIEEKPKNPKSDYAVTGLYFYDNKVVDYAKSLKPSNRGELEITDLNNIYLKKDKLDFELFGRGFAWLDTGTHESLLEASQFIHTIEKRQGLKVACLEEISLNNNWINKKNLEKIINSLRSSDYKKYLVHLLEVDI